MEKRERYKKFKSWVDESFVNKMIFLLAIVAVLLIVFVFIPKGIKLIQKRKLIDSHVVYIASGGNKYHLYETCSNMSDAVETNEYFAEWKGRDRCSKCYSGVEKYTSKPSKSDVAYTMINSGLFGSLYSSKYTESENIFENFIDAESNRSWIHAYSEPGNYDNEEMDEFRDFAIARSYYGWEWFASFDYLWVDVYAYVVDPNGVYIVTAKNGELLKP